MTTRHTPRKVDVEKRAWEIHRQNGHPNGYEGPCWGLTPIEYEQARRELS